MHTPIISLQETKLRILTPQIKPQQIPPQKKLEFPKQEIIFAIPNIQNEFKISIPEVLDLPSLEIPEIPEIPESIIGKKK
jgi:hypothetical protein